MRQYAPRTGTFSRPKPCHNIKLTHYPVLTWEMLRYQRMKVGVLAAHQRPALAPIARLIVSALSVSTGIWRIWRAPRKLMPGRSFEQSREVKPACRALIVAFNY